MGTPSAAAGGVAGNGDRNAAKEASEVKVAHQKSQMMERPSWRLLLNQDGRRREPRVETAVAVTRGPGVRAATGGGDM